jgi:hypothetical protein
VVAAYRPLPQGDHEEKHYAHQADGEINLERLPKIEGAE